MDETFFAGERPDLADRFAGLHYRDSKGFLFPRGEFIFSFPKPKEIRLPWSDHLSIAQTAAFHSGGGGCISTVGDYMKLLLCLLNDGVAPEGTRLLRKDTVEEMFKDSLPEGVSSQIDDPIESFRKDISNDAALYPG